jgi:1,4-dihydroxy-2-naphthoyl-CoA hydrolase
VPTIAPPGFPLRRLGERAIGGDTKTTLPAVLREALVRPAPFDLLYGLELLECSDRLLRGRVPRSRRTAQPVGLVHGGVYAAIAESLASTGTNCGVIDDGMVALGLSSQSSFPRPIASGHVNDEAVRRHRGAHHVGVGHRYMTNDGGQLCAISRMTIAVRPHAGLPT